MNNDLLNKVKLLIDEILPEIIELRHNIHQHPEIALKEYNTSKLIREKLTSIGIEPLSPFLETDTVAFINKGKKGKNITLRADIDALPIFEKTGLPYKSVNEGFMHACGHDGHTAMLFGAAKVLDQIKKDLKGSVRFVFQPGEEVVAGGEKLIKAGALEDPKPDAVYAMHNWMGLKEGVFSSKAGPFLSAADVFKIIVKGKGAHGSTPEDSIDSILTAAKIIDGLNQIVSRKISALDSAVISVCKIQGGTSSNVIPETTVIEGTVRYFEAEVGKRIRHSMEKCIKGICESMEAGFEYIYERPYIPLINDINAFNSGKNVVKNIFGNNRWIDAEVPKMGAEDFAYFIKDNPGALFIIGNGIDSVPLHSPYYNFNDDIIKSGILFFVALVLEHLA